MTQTGSQGPRVPTLALVCGFERECKVTSETSEISKRVLPLLHTVTADSPRNSHNALLLAPADTEG